MRAFRPCLWLVALFWFPLLVASAAAQPAAPAEEATEDNRTRALTLFDESELLYRDGKFDEAAAKLEEAYSLHKEPILLYNLARARDGNGEFEAAVIAYREYLDSAEEIRDRGAIERRIETLSHRIAEQKKLEAERAQAKQKLTEMEKKEQDRAPEGGGGSVLTGPLAWVVMGVGLAGVAVGGVLGAMASSKHDEAAAEPVQVDAVARQDEAEGMAIGANIAFAVGGVLAVGGGTLAIIGLVGSSEPEASAYRHPPRFVGATWRTEF